MLTRLVLACAAWLVAACSSVDEDRSNTGDVWPMLQLVAASREAHASDAAEILALEPCDPTRLAVLFVHGANGSPSDWLWFAERLDRSRYQALFFAYPPHASVDEAARRLHARLLDLQRLHGCAPVVLTAHSLGGLVVRSFLLEHGGAFPQATLFVSLSTPWAGEPLAKLGVRLAPKHPSAWADLVPGSRTLRRLFASPLPEHVQHVLFFSHKGRYSILPGNRDGAVTLASQLDQRAQREAVLVVGFDEDHEGILESAQVFERYAAVLDGTYRSMSEAMPGTSPSKAAVAH
ncbi:MAG: alpha/beta fold hydrolase [Rhizobiales bacterium]|nr:alpha/beta fold hydrolase [Rhizobacter sp.]